MKSIISIDIGEKNLGYTVARANEFNKETSINDINFVSGTFDIERKKTQEDVVLYRVSKINEFLKTLINENDFIEEVIIERQVPTNLVAMCLMYTVVSFFNNYTDRIILFDPKLKFTKINQVYTTKNKKHKQQSIENLDKIIQHYNKNESLKDINEIMKNETKKDDIADSFNQLIIMSCQLRKIKEDFDELKQIYNSLL